MNSDRSESSLIQQIIQELIGHGEQFLKAGTHERTEERRGYANGYKPKGLRTRMGALELEVPQVRGLDFYPQGLEKGHYREKKANGRNQQFTPAPILLRKAQTIRISS